MNAKELEKIMARPVKIVGPSITRRDRRNAAQLRVRHHGRITVAK